MITPCYFIGQLKEKLYHILLNLEGDIYEADFQTQPPKYNHRFDGISEKFEKVYGLIDEAYKICIEISKK